MGPSVQLNRRQKEGGAGESGAGKDCSDAERCGSIGRGKERFEFVVARVRVPGLSAEVRV